MNQADWPVIPGYRILRRLGSGGMATVYLSIQESLERQVALKVMKAALAADEKFSERFGREARTAARLQHPGIVGIFDTGTFGHHSFIAMEYVPGQDLKARLHRGSLSVDTALPILRQMADALNYAHSEGFVHRDVKPANILFRINGDAILADFGIARAVGSSTRMTATGLSIGTPHYMSPEQARGLAVDGRSDLYALGIIFYEMLTGRVPFDAQDSFAVGLMHISDPIPQLDSTLAKYQPIINRLLAKDPDDRYQIGAELIEDLNRVERSESDAPMLEATRPFKLVPEDTPTNQTVPVPNPPGTPRSAIYWSLGTAVAATFLIISLYFYQKQGHGTPPIATTITATSHSSPEFEKDVIVDSAATPDATLEPETTSAGSAALHVTTTPEGAEVLLNNRRLGLTPLQADKLSPGEHHLRLISRLYEPWETTLRLENEKIEHIEAELERGVGAVTVVTDPPGAEIWIEGERYPGTTPLTVSDLASGDLQLEIRLRQHRTVTHWLEVLPNGNTRLDLQLEDGELFELDGRWLTGPEIVSLLLEAANADFAATRLMQPEGNNAWEKYKKVLTIRPGDEQATAGIARIAGRYVELAERALDNRQFDRSEDFLANARVTGAEGSRFGNVADRLQQAREQQRAEQHPRQLIMDIQLELARMGKAISPDGDLGERTVEYIRAFERGTERPERGEATEELLTQLRASNRWPAPQSGELFRDCQDCPEMVVIPSGRFIMGSPSSEPQRLSDEGPQREVSVSTFALGKYAVTFDEWEACVAHGGCSHQPSDRNQGGKHPVVNVSWEDAQQYVRWLSNRTGKDYRLASEAEWEFAARAGTTTRFNTGDCITTDEANFDGAHPAEECPRGRYRGRTMPAGSFQSNAFGLFDMHGNVWEWTEDCWNGDYIGAPGDGNAWISGNCDRAVARGGSWHYPGNGLRSASRGNWARADRFNVIGFRVARAVP